MKDKILETEISNACETIAKALRHYSDEPMALTIWLRTHEPSEFIEELDTVPERGTDYYTFDISDRKGKTVFELGRRISYCIDQTNGQEAILGTRTCFGGIDDEGEEQNE